MRGSYIKSSADFANIVGIGHFSIGDNEACSDLNVRIAPFIIVAILRIES